jgi:group I intron endonuclease
MLTPDIRFIANPKTWRSDLLAVPRVRGVYAIRNVLNGRRYVGSAINMRARWRGHLTILYRGHGKTSSKLLRAWQKYGAQAFVFEVLEEVPNPVDLIEIEQRYIEALQAVLDGYNTRPHAKSNLGIRYDQPMSDERRRKIGAANSIALRGKIGPMRGRQQTEAARAKMRASKRARPGKLIAFQGEALCLSDWAERLNIPTAALSNRLRRGWPLGRALTEPSRGY